MVEDCTPPLRRGWFSACPVVRLRIAFAVALGVEVGLAGFGDQFAGLDGAAPTVDSGFLAFQLFVDGEKVLDFTAHVRPDLIDGVQTFVARALVRNGEDFLIYFLGVDQIQDAEGANFDHATCEAGFRHEDEDIERIAVASEGSGHETIVAGVVQGRVKRAVEAENAKLAIIFIFIGAVLRDFHEHADDFRA